MKAMALDLGSVWIGIAISDPLRLFAKPLTTVKIGELEQYLQATIVKEKVSTIVVGYPQTMRGTQSQQTLAVIAHKEQLEKLFPQVQWIFFDERMTSKQAASMNTHKQDKQKEHAVAAALILEAYLQNAHM